MRRNSNLSTEVALVIKESITRSGNCRARGSRVLLQNGPCEISVVLLSKVDVITGKEISAGSVRDGGNTRFSTVSHAHCEVYCDYPSIDPQNIAA